MFNAICVRTGKSARATLIPWVLHPVAISEILKTTASMILLIEFKVMNASPCSSGGRFGFGKSRAALGRTAVATVPTWSVAPQKENRHRPKPMAIASTPNPGAFLLTLLFRSLARPAISCSRRSDVPGSASRWVTSLWSGHRARKFPGFLPGPRSRCRYRRDT